MENNRDRSLEDLGFRSFSERMHEDVFITSKGSVNVQDMRQNSSLLNKPVRIDGNPLIPCRDVVPKDPKVINVIDELQKITIPVHPDTSGSNSQDTQHGYSSGPIHEEPVSYAEKLMSQNRNKREVNFRFMQSVETREDADIVIPKEVVQKVQDKFENVLYGYFLGNRLPYPVVEYYAKNVWAKFGFSKLMMNSAGFFFFKFESNEGMMKVLEGGPWLIRKMPLFLNKWSPKVSLKKEGIKTIPLWVKLHNVPIAVYTDDGLSLLASKIGVPKKLDSYTADMCADNWGRSSYARAMIEVSAESDLKDYITLAIPKMDEDGYVMERVKVEYEWKPLRCSTCCLFGHDEKTCSKNDKGKAKQVIVDDEGYVMDNRRVARHVFPQKKQKAKFIYKPKTNNSGASSSGTSSGQHMVKVANSFQPISLNDDDHPTNDSVPEVNGSVHTQSKEMETKESEEVLEKIPTEMSKFMAANVTDCPSEGASTPGSNETHVNVSNLGKICKAVFRRWSWTSNGDVCQRGTRIILGWNPDEVDLMVISQSDQVIHTQVRFKADSKKFLCSFVYAENRYQQRRILWENLCKHSCLARSQPWVVLGDFNTALNMEDCLYGPSNHTIGMRDFFECIKVANLMDVKSHGLHYTWNQKPKEGIGVLKKIDRIMSNIRFLDIYPDVYAVFLPARVSDHTPCVLKLPPVARNKQKPFKFPNFLTSKPEFRKYVVDEWNKGVQGYAMFSVMKKLRNLKPCFRQLLHQQGNLHEKVTRLRSELDSAQHHVDMNPLDIEARNVVAKCLHDFQVAAYDEECFLKQKSKIEWLCAGDSNTSYFHNAVKSRNSRNKICCIHDVHGNRFEGKDVITALVDHYSNFLGNEQNVQNLEDEDLFINSLNIDTANHMVRQVTREEVKAAMFSIGENKAPGPDGFTSAFFKHSWDIVGDEVTNAILDFFQNGKLLKQVNHTILALVPKKDTPNSVIDYRPISCCNVLFKCISKIITDRIKGSLEGLVSINQSAFVPGRKISDNILLTQELMHNYHLNRGPARCAFKIDIQKAYDTVNWSFLETILKRFGFHCKMVKWIMTCVTTVSYSLSINGELHGYFTGKRGLRQGDPLSPYLFTLVMEVLTLLLQKAALHPSFKFHANCPKQKIISVSFADDLFIFSHGDSTSVKHLKDALVKFTNISGLVPSPSKSTVFFGNVPRYVKDQILEILPFQEGTLPVRYLGVPLISTRLAARDCRILVERVERRIDNWMSKSLPFAGRLQLINSVLAAMYSYWASVFMLPQGVIKELEKRLRTFLWNGGYQGSARAKVAWKLVCTPKDEGGLSIRSITDVNNALLTAHIWSILSKRKSLWVQWIHSHKLRGKNFWDVQCRGAESWGWRKLLSIRDKVRSSFWMSIRSGRQTNIWSDNWCPFSPLRSFISPRAIANAGFTLSSMVADLVADDNGQWLWPEAWYDIYPVLINIDTPQIIAGEHDRLRWKDLDGNLQHFETKEVWNSLRNREDKVLWVKSVWFAQCIPRHSFHLWLVIKNKLKTQDRLTVWEAGSATNLQLMCCPLCKCDRDSRDHLFFQCHFSSEVWGSVRKYVDMGGVLDTWSSIIQWMELVSNSRTLEHIICKILVAATTYFIWQERNNRLFSTLVRNAEALSKIIIDTVRLRIMGFKVSGEPKYDKILERWLISKNMDLEPG
ncbi:uncharacterized protein LOC110888182 [Helianthus annuus]|uniref:uncharacterized protein LOC110888182 n=1 Tax=Helianthus annuus TaxID=4232 RepID=UPI000B8F8917|nr:uncharacterized protein LOC110888182 [Helianthus annuus]